MNRIKHTATLHTSRILMATVGASLALAAAVPAGSASASVPHTQDNASTTTALSATGVEITSPSATRAVTGSSVRVTLRAGTGVTGIKAFIGTTDISKRLSRHGRIWSAEVPVHLVGQGTRSLLVQALTKHGSGGTASETFTVGHTVPGLLASVHTRTIDSGAVTVSARTTTATKATLAVNGVAVADINDPGFRTAHTWRLTKLSGLRSGVNQVTLFVQNHRGGIDTKRWTFKHTLGSGRLGADGAPALGVQGLYVGTDLESVDGGSTYNTMYIAGKAYTSTLTTGSAVIVQLDAATLAPVATSLDGTGVTPRAGTVTVAVWKDHNVSFAGQPNGSRIWIGTREVAENESMGDCPGDGNCNTNLHGWLEPAAGVSPATWTDSDMLNVQTRQAGDTTTTNTMKVGDKSYPVSLSSGATGGFELLTLDNVGEPTGPATAYSLVGNTTADAATEGRLATELTNANTNGHVTVLLQGFGKLPAINPTGSLANAIAALGGNADVVSRFGNPLLPANGYYALVSARYTNPNGAALPIAQAVWLSQEASSERSGDGVLQSLLVRDQTQNDYVPMTTTPAATTQVRGDDELTQLVYQAPSSWSDWVPDDNGGLRAPTSAEQAAFTDIATALEKAPGSSIETDPSQFLCPSAPDPLRGALCSTNSSLLLSEAQILAGLSFTASQGAAGGYTAADFATVRTAVEAEFQDAAVIRSAVGEYQKLFGDAKDSAIVNAPTIGDNILKNLPKSTNTADTDAVMALNEVTTIASAAGSLGPEMRMFSTMLKLEGMFMADSGPGPQLGGDEKVTQDTAAANIATQLNDASKEFGVYGDFLDSDPVKLMQGAHLLGTEYGLAGHTENDVETATEYAVNRYLWGTLMAPVYTVWSGPTTLGNPLSCINANYDGKARDPFANSDANAFWAGVGTESWIGLNIGTGNFGSNGAGGSYEVFGLPAATADQLAGPIDLQVGPTDTTNVGAVEPYFENTYLTTRSIPTWVKGQNSPYGCMYQS